MPMTKVILVILLLISVPHANGQPDADTINALDIDYSREGYWIIRGADKPGRGFCDTCKVEEGRYEHNRKQGKWIKYYPNGKVKLIYHLVNSRPNGDFEKFFENGNPEERGTFKRNRYVGLFERYYESGCIRVRSNYNQDGKEHGLITYFFNSCESTSQEGQVEFQFTAVNGVPTDTARRFYPNGDPKEIIRYDSEGKVISKEQFAPKRTIRREDPIRHEPKPDEKKN